ncbi:hypothetical protein EGM51_12610 [Verrucomicrobia bacterium S94]|nr:hypothetical protein EGM51_12610 [Verrucomicrobia bacterium S94]
MLTTLSAFATPPTPPLPGGGGDGSGGDGEAVPPSPPELRFKTGVDFGTHAELFERDHLLYDPWRIREDRMAVTGETYFAWTDHTASNVNHRFYIFNSLLNDTDGDGFTDLRETMFEGTSPTNFNHVDVDNDGMHDWNERLFFGSLDEGAEGDFDEDGLENAEEMEYRTSGYGAPRVVIYSDPANPDTDGDGMDDYYETVTESWLDPTDPRDADWDRDRDGLSNLEEYHLGTDLREEDTDGDGFSDYEEHHFGLDPLNAWPSERTVDSDGDGMPNGYELENYLNAFDASDKFEDMDNDGLSNFYEYENDLLAGNWDTDADGFSDGIEVDWGTDPKVWDDPESDDDEDVLNLRAEYQFGTNPGMADSDGDGISDGTEAGQGSNPADGSDSGEEPEVDDTTQLKLTVGDHSTSESEIYEMTVSGERTIRLNSGTYGEVVSETFTFKRGETYTVTIRHIGTSPEQLEKYNKPDFDYTALVSFENGWVLDDTEGILRVRSNYGSDSFRAAGKQAKVHAVKLKLEMQNRDDGWVSSGQKAVEVMVGETFGFRATVKPEAIAADNPVSWSGQATGAGDEVDVSFDSPSPSYQDPHSVVATLAGHSVTSKVAVAADIKRAYSAAQENYSPSSLSDLSILDLRHLR